ncbi:hypothetical protein DAPPUDRAFT_105698 [Daphnia pulex]|uniref:Uncharacterized protein n=1 Tax=Daphnia pulex TaxID=6669 RepID=E9GRI6_DAPPU|nr:hypothetical protein DAPPUDRAFT_105698 [Daphnia pulex]|eukprot:EFX77907.1 hypothetical protein DAPPUDRAFT_105698 [Daphnia pulex]
MSKMSTVLNVTGNNGVCYSRVLKASRTSQGKCKESHGMFVRQNCCIPLDEEPDDNVPAARSVSPPIPRSPTVSEDKLKVKSRILKYLREFKTTRMIDNNVVDHVLLLECKSVMENLERHLDFTVVKAFHHEFRNTW